MIQEILKQNDFHRTSDLACCVTLVFFGFPIESIERMTPKKAIFLFKRSQKLDEILTKYWKRQLKVEPAAYFEQLSFIKARLYSEE